MKGKLKISTALFVIILLLLNIVLPTARVIATVSGDVTLSFNGPWIIGDVTVDANYNGPVTIDADTEITLTNFDSSIMRAYLKASDGFEADLIVDANGKTKLSTANCDGLPGEATIEFKVVALDTEPDVPLDQPTSNNIEVVFDSENINGNVVTYNVDGTDVTLTVVGTNISNNRIEIDRNSLESVTFTIGNAFDSEKMDVVIGSENYKAQLNVNNNIASLNGLNFPNGGLHLAIEPKSGNDQSSGVPLDQPTSNNIEVVFDSENINGNVVTYNVDGIDVTLTVVGTNISNNRIEIDRNSLESVTFTIENTFNSEKMDVVVIGSENYRTQLAVNNNTASLYGLNFPNGGLHLGIEPKGGGGDPLPEMLGGDDDIEFDALFTNTHMKFWINNINVMDDQGGNAKNEFKGTIENAGTNNSNETNQLKFIVPFGDFPITNFIINDVEYQEGNPAVSINNEEWIIDVPGANTYVIRGEGDTSVVIPRTIIWVNPDYVPTDDEDANWVSDFTISHGYARAIAVYDNEDNLLDPSEYTNERGDVNGLDNGFGWVSIYPGSRVIFEFEPEYGYQLTDIKINEQPIENPTDIPNRYEFEMIEESGNIHFAANFEKKDNTSLLGKESSVTNMEYTLDDGALNSGTAKLSIDKVDENTLTDTQKERFAATAGDNYEVSTYLDVDLTQVWYKGKDDATDVWTNEIYDLGDKNATITITLDEGITPDDIVILHELHDNNGNVTGYETVKIKNKEQDENGIWTITFETSKFSNYAIASKKEGTTSEYTVTFNTNGGSTIESQVIESGAKATKPATVPIKNGCVFDDWYADSTLEVKFDFNTPITSDTIIYAKWNTDNTSSHIHTLTFVPAVAATCSTNGNIAYYECSECGKCFTDETGNNEILATDIIVNKLGHNWDAGVITTPATCTTEGVKTYTCKNDSSHTRTEKISETGHDWSDWEVAKEATYTETGLKVRICKNDSTHTEEEIIPKLILDPNPTTPEIKVVADDSTPQTDEIAKEVKDLIESIVNGDTVEGISSELAEKIEEAITNEKTIKVELSVEKVSEEQIKDDSDKVKDVIGSDVKIGRFFDINILIKIDNQVQDETITELNNNIKISIPIPTDLEEIQPGYTREYTVVRVHDGVATLLATKVENGEIVAESNLFSTYALVYKDIKETSTDENSGSILDENTGSDTSENSNVIDNTNTGANENSNSITTTSTVKSETPKTGDDIYTYIILVAVAFIGIIITAKHLKKRK